MSTKAQITIAAKDEASRTLNFIQRELLATERTAAAAASTFSALTGGALAGIGGAAFVAYAKAVNNGVDSLNDFADATGASIENASALEDIAARTGTTFDTVGKAVVKFNQVLGDAKPGSDAAEIIKQLGLNLEDLKKQDPAEALRQTAVAFEQITDPASRARVVQELFGKSVREVAPFLKDLSEQTQLVGTVTTEAALEAEKFNKEIFALQKNALDFSRALTTDVVKSLNVASAEFKKTGSVIEAFRALMTGNDQYKNDVKLVELTEKQLSLEQQLAKARALGALGTGKVKNIEGELARVNDELKTTLVYRKALTEEEAKAKSIEAAKPSLSIKLPEKAKAAAQKELESSYESLSKRIEEQLGLTREELNLGRQLSAEEKFIAKIQADAAASKKPLTEKELADLRQKLELYKQQTVAIDDQRRAQEIQAEFLKSMSKARDDERASILADEESLRRRNAAAKELIADMEFERSLIGLTSKDRELAIKLRELEALGIKQSSDDFKAYADEFKRQFDLTEAASRAKKEFDEIRDAGVELFKGNSDGIKRMVQNMIDEIIKLKVVEPILRDVFGITPTTGVGGSGFAGLFPGATGLSGGGFRDVGGLGSINSSVLDSILGGFFADGGRPPVGKVSVVGERGPELFVPGVPGSIIPNSALGGLTFAPSTVINVSGGGADARTLERRLKSALDARDAQWRDQLAAAKVI